MIRDGVARDAAFGAEADLDAVLCSAGGGPDACDYVVVDLHFRAGLIGGDAILLVVVDAAVFHSNQRPSTAAALHQNSGAALATVQICGELHVANGHAVHVAGCVGIVDADEVRRAFR